MRWPLGGRAEMLVGAAAVVVTVIGAALAVPLLTSEQPDPSPRSMAPDSTPQEDGVEIPVASAEGESSRRIGGKLARIQMVVRPALVDEGERPAMSFVNLGNIELSHGLHFKLEARTPTGWLWINRDQAFPLPLLFLTPNEESEPEQIAIYYDSPEAVPLAPGRYRVSRTFDTDAVDLTAPSLTVAVTFDVVRNTETGATTALESDYSFEPYPGSRWYGPDGAPVPMESRSINAITGPDHCDWSAAVMLHLRWSPEMAGGGSSTDLQYIRDPDNVIGYGRLSNRFRAETSLPEGARYTGYRTDFMELWVRTYRQGMPAVAEADRPNDIYLVYEDHVERWPLAKEAIGCA